MKDDTKYRKSGGLGLLGVTPLTTQTNESNHSVTDLFVPYRIHNH